MGDEDDQPVAVITGGARGIGAATGRQLVAAGWQVALIDIAEDASVAGSTRSVLRYDLAGAADLAEAVAAASGADQSGHVEGAAAGFVADVRDAESLAVAVEAAAEHFGHIDAAVAAAGAIAGGDHV